MILADRCALHLAFFATVLYLVYAFFRAAQKFHWQNLIEVRPERIQTLLKVSYANHFWSKTFNPVPKVLRERFLAYRYLFNGTSLIEEAYKKSSGNPFKILTPGGAITMVTSQCHIRELDRAPRNILSLHAVAKEVGLQTYQTFTILTMH
ncbi:cytochrome P450 protein [Rutstroemia sp. NJR-2017a BBW]|nr:cytochrome P450 protein [Rutstroemia sp. NJR-2017a BBW]